MKKVTMQDVLDGSVRVGELRPEALRDYNVPALLNWAYLLQDWQDLAHVSVCRNYPATKDRFTGALFTGDQVLRNLAELLRAHLPQGASLSNFVLTCR